MDGNEISSMKREIAAMVKNLPSAFFRRGGERRSSGWWAEQVAFSKEKRVIN